MDKCRCSKFQRRLRIYVELCRSLLNGEISHHVSNMSRAGRWAGTTADFSVKGC